VRNSDIVQLVLLEGSGKGKKQKLGLKRETGLISRSFCRTEMRKTAGAVSSKVQNRTASRRNEINTKLCGRTRKVPHEKGKLNLTRPESGSYTERWVLKSEFQTIWREVKWRKGKGGRATKNCKFKE